MSETEELDGEGGATDTEGWGEEETESQETKVSETETQDGEAGASESDWEEEGESKW